MASKNLVLVFLRKQVVARQLYCPSDGDASSLACSLPGQAGQDWRARHRPSVPDVIRGPWQVSAIKKEL